jgi:plasmid stabilization system protein ParE
MSGFILAPSAKGDLVEIWKYYAIEVGDVDLADRMQAEIFKGIRNIARNPGIGHFRRDLSDEPLKFWRVRGYLIIYRVKAKPIQIVRILHGARDVAAILGKN